MSICLTALELQEIVAGELVPVADVEPVGFSGVVCDSREVVRGSLFIARRGDSADGHEFVSSAFSSGAAIAMVERGWFEEQSLEELKEQCRVASSLETGASMIIVQDSTNALGELAAYWRRELDVPVIALSGSNGKTTTKEYIAHVLSTLIGPGMANIRSYNNHVGLPLTVLHASRDSKWVVLEAGMNHAGELDYLGKIVKPDIATVLNVGSAHLGYFNSLSDIASAKCELFAHVRKGGTRVFMGDDTVLVDAADRSALPSLCEVSDVTFGWDEKNQFFISDYISQGVSGARFRINRNVNIEDRSPESSSADSAWVELPEVGKHNAMNALAAAAMACLSFPELSLQEIAKALSSVKGPPMRHQVESIAGVVVLNDTYNANPTSFAAALDTAFEVSAGKEVGVIMGDMAELGEGAREFHSGLGRKCSEMGVKRLVGVGRESGVAVAAAMESGLAESMHAETPEEAAQKIIDVECPDLGVILVKGSRCMRMEKSVEKLRELANAISSPLSST